MEFLTVVSVIGLALVIAYFLGIKRQIGFGWSLFFSIFLSPVVGFIITMQSPKQYKANPEPSKAKKVTGWILIVVFSFVFVLMVVGVGSAGMINSGILNIFSLCIGLVGAGAYLIKRSKGERVHPKNSIEAGGE